VAPPIGLEPMTDWLTAISGSTPSDPSIGAFTITDAVIEAFGVFCRVDLVRSAKTIKEHCNYLKRYVKEMGVVIDGARIRNFLFRIRNKYPNPRTHRAYLYMLKVFCRDFLKHGEWVSTLKFPRIKPNIITDLPDSN
jgi:hypothetical protein